MESQNLVRIGRKEVGVYLHSVAVKLLRGAKEIGLLAYGRKNVEKASYITYLASTMGLSVSKTENRQDRVKFTNERGEEVERDVVGLHFTLIKQGVRESDK